MSFVSQITAFVVSFGIINDVQSGIVIAAATAAVNAAFLIANAVHSVAHAVTPAPVTMPLIPLTPPTV